MLMMLAFHASLSHRDTHSCDGDDEMDSPLARCTASHPWCPPLLAPARRGHRRLCTSCAGSTGARCPPRGLANGTMLPTRCASPCLGPPCSAGGLPYFSSRWLHGAASTAVCSATPALLYVHTVRGHLLDTRRPPLRPTEGILLTVLPRCLTGASPMPYSDASPI